MTFLTLCSVIKLFVLQEHYSELVPERVEASTLHPAYIFRGETYILKSIMLLFIIFVIRVEGAMKRYDIVPDLL